LKSGLSLHIPIILTDIITVLSLFKIWRLSNSELHLYETMPSCLKL